MPNNNRLIPRARKRLSVAVGSTRAFTSDVSPGGFCVELMQPLARGTTVTGTIELEGERFPFTGQVAWMSPGDPRILKRSRLGVRFTGIANAFFAKYLQAVPG